MLFCSSSPLTSSASDPSTVCFATKNHGKSRRRFKSWLKLNVSLGKKWCTQCTPLKMNKCPPNKGFQRDISSSNHWFTRNMFLFEGVLAFNYISNIFLFWNTQGIPCRDVTRITLIGMECSCRHHLCYCIACEVEGGQIPKQWCGQRSHLQLDHIFRKCLWIVMTSWQGSFKRCMA